MSKLFKAMNLTTTKATRLTRVLRWGAVAAFLALAAAPQAQTLINVDFGVGTASLKTGLAATGMGTNDYWNLYRHYQPKFTPGMALVANGKLDKLKLADGTESGVSVAVNNAPGRVGQLQRRPHVRHLHLRPERQQHHRHRQRPGAGALPLLLLWPRGPGCDGRAELRLHPQGGHEHLRADHANGRQRLEGGQPLAGARPVCRVPRRAGGRRAGRPRRGPGAEWRGRPERPADHLARHQPAPPARRRAASRRPGQHEPPVPRNPLRRARCPTPRRGSPWRSTWSP